MVFALIGERKVDGELVFGEFYVKLILVLDGVGYFYSNLGGGLIPRVVVALGVS